MPNSTSGIGAGSTRSTSHVGIQVVRTWWHVPRVTVAWTDAPWPTANLVVGDAFVRVVVFLAAGVWARHEGLVAFDVQHRLKVSVRPTPS